MRFPIPCKAINTYIRFSDTFSTNITPNKPVSEEINYVFCVIKLRIIINEFVLVAVAYLWANPRQHCSENNWMNKYLKCSDGKW